MKKIILEDIKNMKYLLGYKRGVVISEQVDDNSINPALVASTGQPAATTQPVTPATEPVAASTSIKIGAANPRVQTLQELLNNKFQSGLVADGKYGPKTANAIYKNLASIMGTKVQSVTPQTIQPIKTTQPVITTQPITAPIPNIQTPIVK
jgi:peptidoglycan hydrolase-like protein with peptidoglycan-binding domain